MGSSASKAARKYPTRPITPAAFQNGTEAARPRAEPEAQNSQLAESRRSEAIKKDGADPQFLANLSRLGQVQVDHHLQPIRPAGNGNNTRLFESRVAELELSSSTPTRNHLYAFVLSDLMDRRKSVQAKKDLEKLANEFGIDMERLESLARFVNSPSVDSSTIRPAAGKSEEEGFIATAVWVEPSLKD